MKASLCLLGCVLAMSGCDNRYVAEKWVEDAGGFSAPQDTSIPEDGGVADGGATKANVSDIDALKVDVMGAPVQILPDLDGDGLEDWLLIQSGQTEIHTGGMPSRITTAINEVPSHMIPPEVGDFNADKISDLLMDGVTEWRVYFGPFDGTPRTSPNIVYENIKVIPDIDGDGITDWVSVGLGGGGTEVHSGQRHETVTKVAYRAEWNLRAVVGDLNGDHVPDLVLSAAFDDEVHVYFGPFQGAPKAESEAFVLRRTQTGLHDLFGAGTLAADLNHDGIGDLLVTAPSEREEACSGVRPSLVYFGPLTAGLGSSFDGFAVEPGEDTGKEPDVLFSATVSECLGEKAEIVESESGPVLLLIGTRRLGFALPLSSSRPEPLEPAATPPSASFETASDVDQDGRRDMFYRERLDSDNRRYGWVRSSDQQKTYWNKTLRVEPVEQFFLLVDLNGDKLGFPIMWEVYPDRNARLLAFPTKMTGAMEIATFPIIHSWKMPVLAGGVSRGDIDGDGIQDLAWGNVLIRRR